MRINKQLKLTFWGLPLLCAVTMVYAAEPEPPEGMTQEVIDYIEEVIENEVVKDREAATETEDGFEFGGYLRTGTNTLVDGGARNGGSCFALNYPKNDGIFYRLGNECRDYGEFQFTAKKNVKGVDVKAVWMIDVLADSRGSTATESFSNRERQLYVEMDNLLPNGKLWMGRRYYRAVAVGDVHILDYFHINSSGNGFGVSDIEIGENNLLHVAAIGYGGDGEFEGADGVAEADFQNILTDVRYDMGIGDAGRLKFGLQWLFINDAIDDANLTEGATFTAQWDRKLGIFDQKTVFQYGIGSMAHNPGCAGTDGGCFNYAADDDATSWRVFNNATVDLSSRLKLNYMIMYEDSDDFGTLKSVGVRPHYALSDHWSLLGELGYNAYETVTDGVENDEQKLTKFALALQASTDALDFWSRPSLRFYLANYYWNDAAGEQSGLGVPGENDADDALIIGAQAEIWF